MEDPNYSVLIRRPDPIRRYVAKFSVLGTEPDDLTIEKGDVVLVMDSRLPNRWYVRMEDAEVKGYLPRYCLAQPGSLEAELWYFGTISKEQAIDLLLKPVNQYGSYLIRETLGHDPPHCLKYDIAIRYKDRVIRHCSIATLENGRLYISIEKYFSDLQDLVSYYQRNSDDLVTNLRYPCRAPPELNDNDQAACPTYATKVSSNALQLPKKPHHFGFFGKLMRVEAEEILRHPINPQKCFLIRISESRSNALVISIKGDSYGPNKITHHLVKELSHGFKFSVYGRTRDLRTFELMVAFLMNNVGPCCQIPHQPANHNIDLSHFAWYHKVMTRERAEEILLSSSNEEGSYLVRKSETLPGQYALSVRVGMKVSNFKVYHQASEDKYCIDSRAKFKTLGELVTYHHHHNLFESQVTLRNPAVLDNRDIA